MESSDAQEPNDWISNRNVASSTFADDVATPSTTKENVDFQSFDPRHVSAERIAGAIFCGVVGVAGLASVLALLFSFGLGALFFVGISAAGLLYALILYFSLCWPSVQHRHRQWRLTDVGLEVHHGVWWKHMQAIPWARVQHADVSQGPIQRAYGVGTLTVHTAGTSNSSVNLAGLSHDVAIGIRDEIIRQRASGDVV